MLLMNCGDGARVPLNPLPCPSCTVSCIVQSQGRNLFRPALVRHHLDELIVERKPVHMDPSIETQVELHELTFE